MNFISSEGNNPKAANTLAETSNFVPAVPENTSLVGTYTSYDQYGSEPEGGLNIRELWQKVWRRKIVVVTIVSLVTLFVALQSLRAPNLFQATATIEIQPDAPSVMQMPGYLYDVEEYEIKTALFLLTSNPLLEDVVASLKLYQNDKFLGAKGDKSLWETLTGLMAKQEINADAPADPTKYDAQVVLDLRQKSPEELRLIAGTVKNVQEAVTVKQERGTRLIHIAYQHTEPEIAALVANGIARIFIERAYTKKTTKFTDATSWLERSTRELESQMQKADQELANYTRNNNIFAQDAKDDLSASKLAHLHGELMKAETDRLIKQSLFEEVKQGRVAQLPDAFSNTTTAELQKKLSELTVQVAQLSVKYGSRNPKVVEVQEQMAAIRSEIEGSRGTLEEKLKADYQRSSRDEGSIKAALNKAKVEAVQQNQTLIQYNILKQKVDTAKQIYTDFLQKTRQAEIQRAEQSRNVSIAQPAALPQMPVGPMRKRAIMLAFILSLAASIGLVFMLDHLDNRIKSSKDVGQYLRLPALGLIPAMGEGATKSIAQRRKMAEITNGMSSNDKRTALATNMDVKAAQSIAESYRMLRTSLLLASAGRPPRTILVTSSQPSEGKTTTSVNIAISLAQLGAKVLIIDADMRRPRIHKTFGLKSRLGLSTYLSNDVEHHSLIYPANGVQNLYVMPAGIIPPNAGDLLASEKMPKLLSLLSLEFDHIVLDSPPVISVADPVILSRHVDGVVLVIHSNKCSRDVARHARNELANVGAKILGVVLNNVEMQDFGYDYYMQRYYGYENQPANVNGNVVSSVNGANGNGHHSNGHHKT